MLSIRNSLQIKKCKQCKVKEWKKLYHKSYQRKARVAVLLLNKVDSRVKKMTRGRGGYYIMTKGSIYQDSIAILSTYAPNNSCAKYMKQN